MDGECYLYADFEEGQATLVEIQCEMCEARKVNENDATYKTRTGKRILGTYICTVSGD